MGLATFRWRFFLIVGVVILLWQTSKIWLNLNEQKSALEAQLQEGQTISPLSQEGDQRKEQIQVAVYYEALCPDSRSFFVKQLLPTYKKIGDNLKLDLVPYGKATTVKTDDDYQFVCQHGPIECEANTIHACSIATIKDPATQLEYVTCMIKNNMEPRKIMASCAEKLNIQSDAILECASSKRGRQLLAENGDKTNSLSPTVSFIPTIALNGNTKNQVRILKNLLQEVCLLFKLVPEGCMV